MSHSENTLLIKNISRRGFLKGTLAGAALVLAAKWDFAVADEEKKYGADAMPNGWVDDPNVFISIHNDGSVTIVNHRSEMGQGIRTSLVMVVADELGADWSKVTVLQADANEEKYGNQNTDGSRSMRHWFNPMRRAAASARTMLEQAAAQKWQVPVAECKAGVHEIIHTPSGKKLGFAEVAETAGKMPVPARDSLVLKSRDEWRYMGRETGDTYQTRNNPVRPLAVDGEDIVQGKALYGADIHLEGMVYAVIQRPLVYGSTLKSVDDSATQKVPGVIKTLTLDTASQPAGFSPLGGVAVIASNTWAAIKGRNALKIGWDETPAGENAQYDSVEYRKLLEATAQKPGKVIRENGDLAAGFEKASDTISAQYYMPHMAQAPMEPPVAIAKVTADSAEVWAPVQNPQATKGTVAAAVGLKPEQVTVHVTLLGGGFGRKSKPDYAAEAAILAKQVGKPVRVQWTREDDLHHSYFHTVSLEHFEAGLDKNGKPTAWLHRSLAPTISSLFTQDPMHKAVFELGMGLANFPYDIPAMRIENPEAPAHVRIGWFRSVYNLPHAFGIQSFIAECAHKAGIDHKKYILDLLGPARKIDPPSVGANWNYGENPKDYPIDIGRMRGVIEKVTDEAGWGKKLPEGRGMGLAMHHSFVSYAAVVMDVEVEKSGNIIIHSADIAYDCGPQINPERIRSQLEGAIVMGIGIALQNEISVKDGKIQQDNFHQYLLPRMVNSPRKVRVHLVNNNLDIAPGGVGEPGLPPVAPALCNAIFAATGKRIRTLPIAKQLSS
ncbi:xanthine dehydrogenase family protein molybdopterin-binding subunit [Sessilibacter sp. MAH4]